MAIPNSAGMTHLDRLDASVDALLAYVANNFTLRA